MSAVGTSGRRAMRAVVIAVTVSGVTACTTSGSSEDDHTIAGSGSGSCAHRVLFEGHIYTEATVKAEVGKEVGMAQAVGCHDSSGTEGNSTLETENQVVTYAIHGVNPKWAIAAGDSRRRALTLVREGADLPESVQTALQNTK